MNTKKLLIIFTFKYPYSPPTEQFLDDEMQFIAQQECDVMLVPVSSNIGNEKYSSDGIKNVTVCKINRSLTKEIFWGALFTIQNLSTFIHDIFRIYDTNTIQKRKAIFGTVVHYIQAGAVYRSFIKQIPSSFFANRTIILYSYWLNPVATAETLYKLYLEKKYKKTVLAYARAHGDGDLYCEGMQDYRPCSAFLNKGLNSVFVISEAGQNLLRKQGIKEIEVYRLGVKDRLNCFCPSKSSIPLVVSCSVINENKRVIKIAEILSNVTDKIRWVHFGGGNKEQELVQYCSNKLPDNISWDIRGWTDHETIMNFYRQETPDLFVNVSMVEGIPVSIMEAMSFSIPVLATNAGATSEVVLNVVNGFLIPIDFDVETTSRIISSFFRSEEYDRTKMRKEAYDMFMKRYNSSVNYNLFVNRLLKQ